MLASTAFGIAFLIRETIGEYFSAYFVHINSFISYAKSLWWMPIIFIFFIGYEDLYTKRLPFWDETKKLLKANTLSIILIMAIVTIGKMGWRVSRLTLILSWLFLIFMHPIIRLYYKKLLFKMGIWKEKVLVLGAGKAGELVNRGIEKETNMGYEVIGFLDDNPDKIGKFIGGKKIFGKVKHFTKFIRELKIETIVIAMPSMSLEKYSKLVSTVQKHVKNTLLIPELKGISLISSELSCLFDEELFLIKIKNNMKNPLNIIIKRSYDMVLSILLLPIILPIILIISALIKIDSPGPIFFRQDRLGKDMKTFKVIKFRSMYLNADEILNEYLSKNIEAKREWELYKKLRGHDPRVTKIGRFLRKTSLDELPQIFNVLKGEMSLIGPRPFLLSEKIYLGDYCDDIVMVRPGITGLWQVSGRNELVFEDRIRLDLWYVKNWSLWLDTIIMLKTIKVVLSRKGAY
ncbi:MAG: undecaprenyl-phosphate galactose phosphotransferase WbaP [Nitrospirae bacterium]|nr:MAG: undecaprenyl-phosphate galactose phosphotransferase WbaP [Nitrospirota bacterium]